MSTNKQALRQLAVDAKELAIIKRYTKGVEAQKKFIAAANPATVLALLDELEAAEKRIAELEAREVKLPPNELVTDTWTSPGDGWEVFDAQKVIDSIRSAGVRIAAGITVKGE